MPYYTPHRLILTCSLAGCIAVGCVGWTGQDQAAGPRVVRLGDEAYMHLMAADGGVPSLADVQAARADILSATCEAQGMLRRNGIDAGAASIPCPAP